MHAENCFITLTYAPENLPQYGSLNPDDWTKFCKKLREKILPQRLRFLQCGEYGEKFARPHHHALIFGYNFPDLEVYKKEKGATLYTSKILSETWGHGLATVGTVTYKSAAYCARYTMKKINGDKKESHYMKLDEETGELHPIHPEYVTMSRRPGLGRSWYEKYSQDVFPDNFVIIQTSPGEPKKRINVPDYYVKLLEKADPDSYAELKIRRRKHIKDNASEYTPERLAAKKKCLNAKITRLKRPIHEDST